MQKQIWEMLPIGKQWTKWPLRVSRALYSSRFTSPGTSPYLHTAGDGVNVLFSNSGLWLEVELHRAALPASLTCSSSIKNSCYCRKIGDSIIQWWLIHAFTISPVSLISGKIQPSNKSSGRWKSLEAGQLDSELGPPLLFNKWSLDLLSFGLCVFVHGVTGLWSHFNDSWENQLELRIQQNLWKCYVNQRN